METIQTLVPQNVWKHFHSLTQIPRPSGYLQLVTDFLLQFGEKLGLESFTDEIGNVIIRKPATLGMENRKGVILQAHMDMVPQKNRNIAHDFKKDPIETYIDGEWVKAKGTTLGADNGLGVAAIMAVLEDTTLKHGQLEALITVDEETGMTGAFGLKPGTVTGEILLNLDSEDEGELYIGCAGGIDLSTTLKFKGEKVETDDVMMHIVVKGLKGGHSGLEINAGRANANKLLARLVRVAIVDYDACLARWSGGDMRNAIPREADALLAVPCDCRQELVESVDEYCRIFNEEFKGIENEIIVEIREVNEKSDIVPTEIQDALVSAIYACQNGVGRMIPSVSDTVETSSNLAIVEIDSTHAAIQILVRSSSDTMKEYLADSLEACFNLAGMKVEFSGSYSGWQPNVDSPILAVMKDSYKELFGIEPKVKVIHAGLECGIIGATISGLDMISFGPTLRSPHSPDERVFISSVQKFYDFLIATLVKIPVK